LVEVAPTLVRGNQTSLPIIPRYGGSLLFTCHFLFVYLLFLVCYFMNSPHLSITLISVNS